MFWCVWESVVALVSLLRIDLCSSITTRINYTRHGANYGPGGLHHHCLFIHPWTCTKNPDNLLLLTQHRPVWVCRGRVCHSWGGRIWSACLPGSAATWQSCPGLSAAPRDRVPAHTHTNTTRLISTTWAPSPSKTLMAIFYCLFNKDSPLVFTLSRLFFLGSA